MKTKIHLFVTLFSISSAALAQTSAQFKDREIIIQAIAQDLYYIGDDCRLPYDLAEQEADLKANQYCGGIATRVSNFSYQVFCRRVSTGGFPAESTMGEVRVKASYSCEL